MGPSLSFPQAASFPEQIWHAEPLMMRELLSLLPASLSPFPGFWPNLLVTCAQTCFTEHTCSKVDIKKAP